MGKDVGFDFRDSVAEIFEDTARRDSLSDSVITDDGISNASLWGHAGNFRDSVAEILSPICG